ncbi:uncharacterized protein LOC133295518 [Gastrolobium bilobum]|uniref:uncharacterized protein LOC133295518 n=1 Tax=Gastrolobium bilobum TaxID=150636 RepID=UPI002AB2E39A|nr:uncharacterized protein LOC133295518 [Gastrolobium bilobum]
MGNCLKNNKISAQDHENINETPLEPSEAKVDQIKTSPSSKLEAPRRGQRMKKKIRFKIEKDDEGDRGSNGNSKSGTVRIRMVMTQQELKRMLRCKDDAQHTSLEQLLGVMKLRGGRISEACEYDGDINSWRPALESIPENSLIE